MDTSINTVTKSKDQGNRLYLKGCQLFPDEACLTCFREACVSYGNAVSSLMSYETAVLQETAPRAECDFDQIYLLKVTLFLNLAAANLKLSSVEGCRRCCNTSLVFCNNPSLPLSELGVDDDITADVVIAEPVLPEYRKYVGKALYRRGKCYQELDQPEKALTDFQIAHRFIPEEKELAAAIAEVQRDIIEKPIKALVKPSQIAVMAAVNSSDASPTERPLTAAEIQALTINGGPCLYQKAYWSQTLEFAEVTILQSTIIDLPVIRASNTTADSDRTISKGSHHKWEVEFSIRSIAVFYGKSCLFQEHLEYNISPSDSTWHLDSMTSPPQSVSSSLSSPLCLVLHLKKVPAVEWFPGCEWWDRVFEHDEPIETTTCSLGTAVGDLPVQAQLRAQREHERFSALTVTQQQAELSHAAALKHQLVDSESRVRSAVISEERAIAEVPERAQMLTDLRKQFPNIDFTAK